MRYIIMPLYVQKQRTFIPLYEEECVLTSYMYTFDNIQHNLLFE